MKKKKTNTDIIEEQTENVNQLRELEQSFVDNIVDKMEENIEKQKEQIVKELIEYANTHKKITKFDREGNPIKIETVLNPLVITNYFFKPIITIHSQEPQYNAEKLGMVFDYYCFLLAEVNDKVGNFPSSLTSFCKLAGITSTTLRKYRNSTDYGMRIVADKIYDQIGDENLTMSQMGIVNERSTIFKLKSQNEMVEKAQPNVNINIVEAPDIDRINERLEKYKKFTEKRKKL